MSAKKILFLFSFFIFTQILFGGIREINNKPSFDDEILVEYKNEFGDKDIDNFYSIYKFKPDTLQRAVEYLKVKYELMEIPARLDGIPFVRYKVKDKENLIEIVKSFQKLSFVNYAQPNYKRYALYTPIPTPIGPNDWYYQQ
ncbi:MAG: hypothetical protein N3E50_06390, partial [Candidatus Goldbacteria bacterium]|nr:hypothetical protein [Candidatus Goldiibacteriota bacterium]